MVFITKQTDRIEAILSALLAENISGATVIDCQGMLKSINEASIEPPPIFGSLRHFINPGNESSKMIWIVPRDAERLARVREIIHAEAGSLDLPNSGILFELPIDNVEGVPKASSK